MKRVSVALILLLILAGCQTAPSRESSTTERAIKIAELKKNKRGFQYKPGTNEEFRLRPLSPREQKVGYKQLCVDTKSFTCDPLPYDKYREMKGFFLSMEPARIDYSGYEFRKVVLQNGKRFFYVSNENYGGIYTKRSAIRRELSINSRIGKPIAKNSTITTVGLEEKEGQSYVKLSNGVRIKKEQFTAFIKVIAPVTNPELFDELTRLLAGQEIVHDIAKDRIVIHHKTSKDQPLQAYIIYKNGTLSLLIRHQYAASKWLHARSFALFTDQAEYKSTRYAFKRKEKGKRKREWYDIINPKADYLKVLSAAVYAEKATLRFYSDNYFIDKTLTFSNKVRLKQTLRGYHLLK